MALKCLGLAATPLRRANHPPWRRPGGSGLQRGGRLPSWPKPVPRVCSYSTTPNLLTYPHPHSHPSKGETTVHRHLLPSLTPGWRAACHRLRHNRPPRPRGSLRWRRPNTNTHPSNRGRHTCPHPRGHPANPNAHPEAMPSPTEAMPSPTASHSRTHTHGLLEGPSHQPKDRRQATARPPLRR